ncbi:MAG: DUF4190 domain-containing protein [Oscillospiraceae bacterium]|nr:DUF4190 domain-containing protein [Oscillospiraceae bacterium]
MFCPNCGAQNADNAPFCANCGSRFEQQAPAAPTYAPPVAPAYAPTTGYVPAAVSNPGKGVGIAAMILGILSLVLWCYIWVSIPAGLVGLILGAIGIKKSKDAGMGNGMAVAGLVTSIVGIALWVLMFAIYGEEIMFAMEFMEFLM